MFSMIKTKIRKNTLLVLNEAKKKKTYPRSAALSIAEKRIMKACKVCKNKR